MVDLNNVVEAKGPFGQTGDPLACHGARFDNDVVP